MPKKKVILFFSYRYSKMVFSSSIRLLSKRQPGFKINQAVVSANQLNKMILQEKERRIKRQRKSENKPKTVKFTENQHMRHFNQLVMQNLSLLKSGSDLQSIVASTGLVFTQVSVTPSWSELFIFWKSSNTSDCSNSDQIQERLDILAPNLRYQLQQLNELGKIPKVVFTRDYQHVRKANFLNIMSSLSESQELEELDVGNVNPALAVSRSLMTHVKLKTDVLNFDREKAMNEVSKSDKFFRVTFHGKCQGKIFFKLIHFFLLKILKTLEKSRGEHRLNDYYHNENPSTL